MTRTSDVAPKRTEGRGEVSAAPGLQAIRNEIDRMFHALSFPEALWSASPTGTRAIGLRIDVAESDDTIQVIADLPGVEEKDIDVSLDGDVLRIRAEKRSEESSGAETWQMVERSYGRFERSVRVPGGIDPDKVKADLSKGVLTVTLPKPEDARNSARKIAISAG